MAERLIVVGGDAAGMSAASQTRRRRVRNDLEILVFERSSCVSYSACGEPYYVGGYVTDIGQLQARTPAEFAAMEIAVHTRHEVTPLNPKAGKVTVRDLAAGTDTTLLRLCGTICELTRSCRSITLTPHPLPRCGIQCSLRRVKPGKPLNPCTRTARRQYISRTISPAPNWQLPCAARLGTALASSSGLVRRSFFTAT
jgi:hypothetical protein